MKHETTESHRIEMGKDDTACIALEIFEDRKIAKTVRLADLIKDYKGADVMLDFSKDNELMGIEILA